MTDKQRDRGRLIAIGVLLIILISAMLSGCSDLLYRGNKVITNNIIHALRLYILLDGKIIDFMYQVMITIMIIDIIMIGGDTMVELMERMDK